MPAKALIVGERADKQFLKLPRHVQKRVIEAYRILKENPISGTRLHGELSGYYKFRVGDY